MNNRAGDNSKQQTSFRSKIHSHLTMATKLILFMFLTTLVLVCVVDMTSANYRKPPFNGSIFGKRTPGAEDQAAEKLYAMCTIAMEACSQWLPATEAK